MAILVYQRVSSDYILIPWDLSISTFFFLTWQSAIHSSSYPVNALMNPQPTQWGTTVSKFHRILWVDLNPNFPVNLSTQLWWLNKFLVNITHVYIYTIYTYIYYIYILYIYTIYIHTCIHTDRHTLYSPIIFLYCPFYTYIYSMPFIDGCSMSPWSLPPTKHTQCGNRILHNSSMHVTKKNTMKLGED